jgi:hypothetical protein
MAPTPLAQTDDLTRRRLKLARNAYQLGVRMGREPAGENARIAAVVQFDFAAETTLKTLVLSRGSPVKLAGLNFSALVNEAERALCGLDSTAQLHGASGLHQVRGVRNAAQHDARRPTPDEVSECRIRIRDALVALCHLVWGIDFERHDVEDVADDDCRDVLRRALEALATDPPASVAWSRHAVTSVVTRAGRSMAGQLPMGARGLVLEPVDRMTHGQGQDAYKALQSMQVTTILLGLGLELAGYFKFHQTTAGAPFVNINGSLTRSGQDRTFDADEAEFALSFALDTVLAIERVVGEIDQPFGQSPYRPLLLGW